MSHPKLTTLLFTALTVSGAACTKKSPPSNDPTGAVKPPVATAVTVELSAVTLGDDCGTDGWAPPPPSSSKPGSPPAPSRAPAVAPPADVAAEPPGARIAPPAGACPPGVACGYHAPCDQTSMQLSITAPAAAPAGALQITQVEFLDDKGAVIGPLTPRAPKIWADPGSYQDWDQAIAPGKTQAVSYLLSAPSWDKVGGRWDAQNKTFQVRVTYTIGGAAHTVEKTAITPAHIEPPVPT